VATNFQFVEPLSVSPRSPRNRRGPASVRLQAAWRCRSIVRPVDHDQRQQAESPLHDVATNFQFVEPPSVSRHCPTNPTRSTVPRRTSLKTCSTIVSWRSEGNRRGPASPIFRTKVAVGRGDGGWVWGSPEGAYGSVPWTTSNDRQVENLSYDVATNFQFVEPPSVSRHCPTNPTRSTVPRRTSLKTCSTIVSRRSEGNRRRPASPPIFRTKVAVGCGDGGWFGAVRRVSTGLLCGPRPATDRLKTYRKAQRPPGAQIRARRGQF